jgi:hypothetical protein
LQNNEKNVGCTLNSPKTAISTSFLEKSSFSVLSSDHPLLPPPECVPRSHKIISDQREPAGFYALTRAGGQVRSYGVPARSDRRLFSQQATAAGTFISPAFLPTGYCSRHVQIAGFSAKQNTASAGMFSLPAFLPTGYIS